VVVRKYDVVSKKYDVSKGQRDKSMFFFPLVFLFAITRQAGEWVCCVSGVSPTCWRGQVCFHCFFHPRKDSISIHYT
jgi:hypothetical protein